MARHRLPAGRGASSSASGVLRPHRPRLSEPQELTHFAGGEDPQEVAAAASRLAHALVAGGRAEEDPAIVERLVGLCLLYTSPSPRDQRGSRMPSSA